MGRVGSGKWMDVDGWMDGDSGDSVEWQVGR